MPPGCLEFWPDVGHLTQHAGFGGAAVAGAALAAAGQVDGFVNVLIKEGTVTAELFQRQLLQRLAGGDAGTHHGAGALVGVPEGHPLFGQVVGAVGGVDKALGGGAAHIVGQRGHGGQHGGDGFQAEGQGIHRAKDGFLVLLHILVVGQGDALHHDQQRVQIAVDPAGLAADQLGDVGVFLLGHDGGPGGEGVVQLDELELPAAPQDDFLRQAGEVHHAGGHGAGQLDAEIPVGHAVNGVAAGRVKAQLGGGVEPVQRIGGARQRAGTQRTLGVHAGGGVPQAAQVPQQHPGVGHELVPKGDRLGPLQVGVARHDVAGALFGLAAERLDQLAELLLQPGAGLPQIEPDVQRHLVVAAAAGVKALAGVPHPGGEGLFHKGVDILGGGVNLQRAAAQIL